MTIVISTNFYSFPLRLISVAVLFAGYILYCVLLIFIFCTELDLTYFPRRTFLHLSPFARLRFFRASGKKEQVKLCVYAQTMYTLLVQLMFFFNFPRCENWIFFAILVYHHYSRVEYGSIAFAISLRIQIETNNFKAENALAPIAY